VRRAGEDLAAGRVALGAGSPLGPAQLALLAALGHDRVIVRPRPRVLVISTGSELIEVGRKPRFGEVVDANSYLLASAARDAGAEARRFGIVADDHTQLLDVLESQLLRADLLITTGGISAGAFDVVKQALSELGTVEFSTVAMQPGATQGFGHLRHTGHDVPVFCLPGKPVSALVSFEAFVRPAIRKLLGKRSVHRATVQAVVLESAASPPGLHQFRLGQLRREKAGDYGVRLIGGTGTHRVAAMAAANCLVVIGRQTTEIAAGSRVTVIPLLLSNR
jgi:molybdopterin molybdotransferase